MSAVYEVNSQDWYRVRRGEDQLAWGKRWMAGGLPGLVFSERARDEFAFLKPWQQAVLKEALRPLPVLPEDDRGRPVAHGQGRRVLEVEGLRVVFRTEPRAVQISTIRGGPVLDPEHTGPAAKSSMSWRPG